MVMVMVTFRRKTRGTERGRRRAEDRGVNRSIEKSVPVEEVTGRMCCVYDVTDKVEPVLVLLP